MEKTKYQEIMESINNTNKIFQENENYLTDQEIKIIRKTSKLNPKLTNLQSIILSFFLAIGVISTAILPFIYFGTQGAAYYVAQIQSVEIEAIKGIKEKLSFYQESIENTIHKLQTISNYVHVLFIASILLFLVILYRIHREKKVENNEN